MYINLCYLILENSFIPFTIMNPFFSGLLSLLTGGISNIFENGGFNNLGNVLNNAGTSANDIGNQNMAGNLVAKYTGSRLTDAEREANAFSATQAEFAFKREADFSREMFEKETNLANTAYQRQVADMQAAGLNPMLALGAGGAPAPSASSVSAAAPGSVSPSGASLNLGSLLQLALEYKMLPSKLANMAADTAQKNAAAEASKVGADFAKDTFELRKKAIENENNISAATEKQIWSQIDKQRAETDKLIKETESEGERKKLLVSQRILNEATARKVEFMMEYEANLLSAQTESQKAKAALDYILASREKNLLDGGDVQNILREAAANADSAEARAAIDRVRERVAHGDFRPLQEDYEDMTFGQKLVNALYSGIHSVRAALAPLK